MSDTSCHNVRVQVESIMYADTYDVLGVDESRMFKEFDAQPVAKYEDYGHWYYDDRHHTIVEA